MQRLYSPQRVEEASRGPWWWSMAGNPPCVPWCLAEHDPNEFRVEGCLSCEADFGHGVRVVSFVAANEELPFSMSVRESTSVCLLPEPFIECMTPEVAQGLARALQAAAKFARRGGFQ